MDTLPSAAAVRKGKKPKRAIEESISEEKKVFSPQKYPLFFGDQL